MALDVLYTQIEKEKISKLIDKTDKYYPLNKIGLLDELHFQVFGYAKIGSLVGKNHLRRDVYAFNCLKHGLQVTFSNGKPDNLACSVCESDLKAEFEETYIKKDDQERLNDKAIKIKTDLSKYRTNKQNSK